MSVVVGVEYGAATPMRRVVPSAPHRAWGELGYLTGRVLDFGSGHDPNGLPGYDPFSETPSYDLLNEPWDVVTCNYVLNVQPSDHLVMEVAALLSKLAPRVCVAVLTDSSLSGSRACGGRKAKRPKEWVEMLNKFFLVERAPTTFCGYVCRSRSFMRGGCAS